MAKLLLIFIFLLPGQQSSDYPLKNGRPTSKGIDRYVEEKSAELILEFQSFVKDSLYNANIYTEDLSENIENDPLELGYYYPNEIFINNAELYLAYELKDISNRDRDSILSTNMFVKAAVLHELMHHYIYQLNIEMRRLDKIKVDRAYQSFFRLYDYRDEPGSRFIEEGICEYTTTKMNETITRKRPYIPKKQKALSQPENAHKIFYKYSAYYLTEFLDTTGIKRGIKLLLHNPPPSAQEILEPELFFSRLEDFE